MSIHPSIQEVLNQVPLDLPRTLTPELIKELRVTRLPLPEQFRPPIYKKEDQIIPGPNGDIPIRIYTPQEQEEKYTGIVAFHGGGWSLGSIESHDGAFRHVANATGAKVISVEYRLAPENPFPTGIEDCYAAFNWVYENAERLNIDPSKIAVLGDSAGGNISASLTHIARDRKGPAIWKQVLIYPATDALRSIEESPYESVRENADAPILSASVTKSFWDYYIRSEEDANHPYCSPIRAESFENLPPALIITAQYDPIRDEGEAYGRKLIEHGIPTTLRRVEGAIHGFMTMPIPLTNELMEEIGRFIKEEK